MKKLLMMLALSLCALSCQDDSDNVLAKDPTPKTSSAVAAAKEKGKLKPKVKPKPLYTCHYTAWATGILPNNTTKWFACPVQHVTGFSAENCAQIINTCFKYGYHCTGRDTRFLTLMNSYCLPNQDPKDKNCIHSLGYCPLTRQWHKYVSFGFKEMKTGLSSL